MYNKDKIKEGKVKTMKTITINLYTPKELFEGKIELIKNIVKVVYCWNKTKSIRKPYGINWKTPNETIKKILTEEDKEKFVNCFPENIKSSAYFIVHGKYPAPKGEFR